METLGDPRKVTQTTVTDFARFLGRSTFTPSEHLHDMPAAVLGLCSKRGEDRMGLISLN